MKELKFFIQESVFDNQDGKLLQRIIGDPKSDFWAKFMQPLNYHKVEELYDIPATTYDSATNTLTLKPIKSEYWEVTRWESKFKNDSIFNYLKPLKLNKDKFTFAINQEVDIYNYGPGSSDSVLKTFNEKIFGPHIITTSFKCLAKTIKNVTIDVDRYAVGFSYTTKVENVEVGWGDAIYVHTVKIAELTNFPVLSNFRLRNCSGLKFTGPKFLAKTQAKISKIFDFTGCHTFKDAKRVKPQKVEIKSITDLFEILNHPKLYTLIPDLDNLFNINPNFKISDLGIDFKDLTNTVAEIELRDDNNVIYFFNPSLKDFTEEYDNYIQYLWCRRRGAPEDPKSLHNILASKRTADGWMVMPM